MMRNLFLFLLVLTLSFSVFTQSKPDYSGVWVVNLSKSVVYRGMFFPPVTRNITQNEKSLDNLSDEKLPIAIVTPKVVSYLFDWSEKQESFKNSSGKLNRFTKSGFNNDNNFEILETEISKVKSKEVKLVTKSTWLLENEGKILRIKTIFSDQDGEHNSEIVYEKEIFKWSSNPMKQLQSLSTGVANAKPLKIAQPYHLIDADIPKSSLVSVLVLVDENGDVMMAKMIEGPQPLLFYSEAAAKSSKFLPTIKNGVAVKETGIVNYFFTKK